MPRPSRHFSPVGGQASALPEPGTLALAPAGKAVYFLPPRRKNRLPFPI